MTLLSTFEFVSKPHKVDKYTSTISIILVPGDDSDHVERERCSHVHLDAITSDNAGNIYAFRG